MPLPFRHITLLGIGLIGSSIARAIKARDATCILHIIDPLEDALHEAEALGLGDVYSPGFDQDHITDLVLICTPVGAMEAALKDIATHVSPGAIISDSGSVKAHVARLMASLLPEGLKPVPGHPVAGTEQSGPSAGFASLFQDRWCILTPDATTDPDALQRVSDFWTALGARVDTMSAEHHDLVLAITSHLPHLIAYNIVGTASDLEQVTQSEVISYSAGGFRDFTRIAASDPTMWRDVFLHNKDAVLETLGRFQEDLSALARAIRWGDGDALFTLFSRTRDIRRNIIDAGQDVAGADFGRTTPAEPEDP